MRETKDGESDVLSRTFLPENNLLLSNLSGIVSVVKFQTAKDDVVEMRETKYGESDVTSRTLSTRKQSVIIKFIRYSKCSKIPNSKG